MALPLRYVPPRPVGDQIAGASVQAAAASRPVCESEDEYPPTKASMFVNEKVEVAMPPKPSTAPAAPSTTRFGAASADQSIASDPAPPSIEPPMLATSAKTNVSSPPPPERLAS